MKEDADEAKLWAAGKRVLELETALRDLVMLERTSAPDMSGKRRAWAYIGPGPSLALCLDRARELLNMDPK